MNGAAVDTDVRPGLYRRGDFTRTHKIHSIDNKNRRKENIMKVILDTEAIDSAFMQIAIEEALTAEKEDEVPIGACIVKDGVVIARAHNTRENSRCATAHAEILAINEACKVLGGWRLPGATLYVTLEPCAMCAGAIVNARIENVVYGAPDIRFGALGSLFDLSLLPLNHKPEVKRFVRGEECKDLLSEYFRKKRKK